MRKLEYTFKTDTLFKMLFVQCIRLEGIFKLPHGIISSKSYRFPYK